MGGPDGAAQPPPLRPPPTSPVFAHTRLQVSVFSSRNHASRGAFSEPSDTKTTAGLSLLCSRHPSTQHPAGGPLQQGRVAPAVVAALTRCWMLANCVINKCAHSVTGALLKRYKSVETGLCWASRAACMQSYDRRDELLAELTVKQQQVTLSFHLELT